MKNLPENVTPNQLKFLETTSRIKMAWVALWFALALFSIGFFAFLGAIFFMPEKETAAAILGGVDLLLAFALHRVYSYLFPKQ
jgi:hypothetical protein